MLLNAHRCIKLAWKDGISQQCGHIPENTSTESAIPKSWCSECWTWTKLLENPGNSSYVSNIFWWSNTSEIPPLPQQSSHKSVPSSNITQGVVVQNRIAKCMQEASDSLFKCDFEDFRRKMQRFGPTVYSDIKKLIMCSVAICHETLLGCYSRTETLTRWQKEVRTRQIVQYNTGVHVTVRPFDWFVWCTNSYSFTVLQYCKVQSRTYQSVLYCTLFHTSQYCTGVMGSWYINVQVKKAYCRIERKKICSLPYSRLYF